MKTKLFITSLIVLLGIGLSVAMVGAQGPNPRAPRGDARTTFTYQGRLTDGGAPANGAFDFEFKLYDAWTGGSQVGGTLHADDISVSNGLFTVNLDFGGVFTGAERHLQIGVRPGASSGAYTTLTPRQELTPVPYAQALFGLYTQQNTDSPNLIGGYSGNSVTSGVYGATIGGGGQSGFTNSVSGNFGTVGGGLNNAAGNNPGTTVGGGYSNTASGQYATIPGGDNNVAAGAYSFAAGHRAKTDWDGSFVWGDSTDADVASTKTNQFVIRATNGVSLTVDAGPTMGISVGERYRDNAIVAWASIYGNGNIDQSFGLQSVTKLGTGQYRITLYASAASEYGLIPVATPEVDAAPTSAAALRIVSINQINSKNIFDVYVNDGTGALVDNDFVFIVTAR